MTFIALAFVLIGTFLIIYSVFIYLQRSTSGEEKVSKTITDTIDGNANLKTGRNTPSAKNPDFIQSLNEAAEFISEKNHLKENGFIAGAESTSTMPNNHDNINNSAGIPLKAVQQTALKQSFSSSPELSEQVSVKQPSSAIETSNSIKGDLGVVYYRPENVPTEQGSGQIVFRGETGLPEQNADARPIVEKDSQEKTIDEKKAIQFRSQSIYYLDRGGQIQYDGTDLEVDETLAKYRKFQRVGEGELNLTAEGITFQNQEFIHHIAFIEMKRIIFYQNCLVVLPREEDTAKIFFPQRYSLFRSTFKDLMDSLQKK